MNLIEGLRNRNSTRKYTGQAADPNHLEVILEALSLSPRAGNLQHFTVAIVQEAKDREDLSRLLFDSDQILNSSLCLVFFVDLITTREWFIRSGAKYPFSNFVGYEFALLDTMAAAQSAALVAESLGYGTCFNAGSILRAAAVAKFFNCPDAVIPAVTLTIGVPDGADETKRHNIASKFFTFTGRDYRKSIGMGLYTDSGREAADLAALIQSPEFDVQMQTRGLSNLAQVLSTLKYKPEEMDLYSENLLTMLKSAKVVID